MTETGDNGKIRGVIMPDVLARGDRGEIANLKKAEEKHGMTTGGRFLDGKEGVVSYLGYPRPRFFFQARRPDGSYDDAVELTREIYDRTHTLKL
ncbi:hypothetical protein [Rhizobium sp. BK176]|uniref:hypothetical protein n=1 Tax=Rhizobium sp. BK176 TaxID=2587071 RepID=UPI002167E3E3|nr:hypothetical protein [Rhizobium sp. BK176]MCS4088712.1 hypothetical protein [Rhizobium sp. BK176]